MYKKITLWQWRIINVALIIAGMMMPWFYIDPMEPYLTDYSPIAGWSEIYGMCVEAIDYIKSFGFEWLIIPVILSGICGILIFFYLIYNLLVIIEKGKIKKLKFAPFAFIGINIMFSIKWLVSDFTHPLLGFWVISLGMLSSAVLEWMNARSAVTQSVQ
jgi:hypothetical protein